MRANSPPHPPLTNRLLLSLIAICILICGTSSLQAQKRSPLGTNPNWSTLDIFQKSITQEEFEDALYKIYSSQPDVLPTMRFGDGFMEVQTTLGQDEFWRLDFAATSEMPEGGRYWRPASDLPPARPDLPLDGIRIAIDPGHIGGDWAKMEERWFQIGDDEAITEGDLTLFTAQVLKPELEKLGAEVFLVRETADPVTQQRPADLDTSARLFLAERGVDNPPLTYAPDDHSEQRLFSVQWQREKLFYRTSEILARAEKINNEIMPDLCLCLHFNAEAWGDPNNPDYVEGNHFHLLINGTYSQGELSYDDVRFEMVRRLLQGIHHEELALAEVVSPAMVKETSLQPYTYPGSNARQVNTDPYLWARNLLANRAYVCPVLYFEPYVMNNREMQERLVYGDYLGRSKIDGKMRESVYREYAAGIVNGLVDYYTKARPTEG